jgi:hypothetical protein
MSRMPYQGILGKDSFLKLACSIDSLPKMGTYVPRALLKLKEIGTLGTLPLSGDSYEEGLSHQDCLERDRCKVFQTPLPHPLTLLTESRVRKMSFQGKAGNEWFPKMSFTQLLAYLPREKKDVKGKKDISTIEPSHSKKSILEPSQVLYRLSNSLS